MSREVKNINPELAKKFLERERRLGKSIGLLTGLFFLVYFPGIVLRKVCIIMKLYNYVWNIISTLITEYFEILYLFTVRLQREDHPYHSNHCMLHYQLVNWNHRSTCLSNSSQKISRQCQKPPSLQRNWNSIWRA